MKSDARDQLSRSTPEVNDIAVGSTDESDLGNQSGRTVAPRQDNQGASIL